MNKTSKEHLSASEGARPDWSNARANPYAGKLAHGGNWRRLDDELAATFRTSNEVNDALRALLALRAVLPSPPTRKRRAA